MGIATAKSSHKRQSCWTCYQFLFSSPRQNIWQTQPKEGHGLRTWQQEDLPARREVPGYTVSHARKQKDRWMLRLPLLKAPQGSPYTEPDARLLDGPISGWVDCENKPSQGWVDRRCLSWQVLLSQTWPNNCFRCSSLECSEPCLFV